MVCICYHWQYGCPSFSKHQIFSLFTTSNKLTNNSSFKQLLSEHFKLQRESSYFSNQRCSLLYFIPELFSFLLYFFCFFSDLNESLRCEPSEKITFFTSKPKICPLPFRFVSPQRENEGRTLVKIWIAISDRYCLSGPHFLKKFKNAH
jgi:hypothetical protein